MSLSAYKHIDRICVIVMVLSLLLTLLFVNGQALGLQSASSTPGYEQTLFDTSRVHTIDIVMDDWDAFIETCESETYSVCTVVIDNEAVKNVAIRGKGNTSLSSVKNMGSQRYSFKIEFDQYESGKTYHGLDKLSLNNIIQDNTYMKDYLTYRLMGEFGVTSPLCSFVYVTVNGEDWGLYLAVEGVEDSFLRRNYGRDTGELYKPDSMSFGGGGPGNGKGFNMEDFLNRDTEGENTEEGFPGFGGDMPEDFDPPQFGGDMPEDFDPSQEAGGGEQPDGEEGGRSRRDSFGGMGSGDVKLQYTDDDPDSYANIFDNAKTDVTQADKARLIQALKKLNACEDIEDVVDVDEVIRYFVVHNYVCNGDSYTGSIVHNYYLHEADGQLSMIPWDYNLAFGTFRSADAAEVVNDPIDTPMEVSDPSDRPMWGWIQSSEEYTALYHEYFAEFLDTVDIQGIIDEAYTLIKAYVEKDPTAFCTPEEFETGVETLRAFCALRTESVRGQLEGEIPSTAAGQRTDSTALVDASGITISAMGSMGGGGGGFGGPGGGGGEASGEDGGERPDSGGGFHGGQGPGGFSGQEGGFPGGGQRPGGSFPGGGEGGRGGSDGSREPPSFGGGFPAQGGGFPGGGENAGGQPDFGGGFPGGEGAPGDFPGETAGTSKTGWLITGGTVLLLLAGLGFALKYNRRG